MLTDLKKQIQALFENSNDEETIKQYATVEKEFDKLKEEQEELLNRNASLQKSLKDVIINKEFKDEQVKKAPANKNAPTLDELIEGAEDYRKTLEKGGK